METVVLLCRQEYFEFSVDVNELGRVSQTATYDEIKAYISGKYGFKVSTLYIAQIKQKCGLKERENYNKGNGKSKELFCPPEKEKAIMDAFKYFGMIE